MVGDPIKMAHEVEIVNIIENITSSKKKEADLEKILKEAKGMKSKLSDENIENLLSKLCDDNILVKVIKSGKHNFRIVRTIEDQTNNEDNATQSNNYQSDVLIAERHDSVTTDTDTYEQEVRNSELFLNYTNCIKEIRDLKEYMSYEIHNIEKQQSNSLTDHLIKENEFLKSELRETRSLINNILESFSRQNHSLGTKLDDHSPGTKLDETWKTVPQRPRKCENYNYLYRNKCVSNPIGLKNHFL